MPSAAAAPAPAPVAAPAPPAALGGTPSPYSAALQRFAANSPAGGIGAGLGSLASGGARTFVPAPAGYRPGIDPEHNYYQGQQGLAPAPKPAAPTTTAATTKPSTKPDSFSPSAPDRAKAAPAQSGGGGNRGTTSMATIGSYMPGGVNTNNPGSRVNQAIASLSKPQGKPTQANRPVARPDAKPSKASTPSKTADPGKGTSGGGGKSGGGNPGGGARGGRDPEVR
jgi:hypothetical protein